MPQPLPPARALLLAPDYQAYLEQAVALANRAIEAASTNEWAQFTKGLAECRLGNWAEALQWLGKPERSRKPRVATLAGGLGAMARHQLGQETAAREALGNMQRRLQRMLQIGILDNGTPDDEWQDWVFAFSVCSEAERVILGRVVSPPLTTESLAAARRQWEPAYLGLREGEALALKRMWKEARDAYARALAAPAFDWETVCHRIERSSPLKMALVFLMAGDQAQHEELCRRLFGTLTGRNNPTQTEVYASAWFLRTRDLAPDLSRSGLRLLEATSPDPKRVGNNWHDLHCGIAYYRNGRFEEAIACLRKVEKDPFALLRGRALIYDAMACCQMGDAKGASRCQHGFSVEHVLSRLAGDPGRSGSGQLRAAL